MRLFLLILMCLLAGIGCDSANDMSSKPETERTDKTTNQVLVVGEIPDTSLVVGESLYLAKMPDLFVFENETEEIYSVWSEPENLFNIYSSSNLLWLKGVSTGISTVFVEARDETGNADTLRFEVEVLDVCPAEQPPAGYASYFPIEVGNRFNFFYSSYYYNSHGTSRKKGTITWDVLSGECSKGIRALTIKETFSQEADVSATEERILTFKVKSDSILTYPYYSEMLPRFLPEASPDTVVFRGGNRKPIFGGAGGWRADVTLVRGYGLQARSYFAHFGPTSDASENLLLDSIEQ